MSDEELEALFAEGGLRAVYEAGREDGADEERQAEADRQF